MKEQKVWFVTGASKGLGFALVKKLLGSGFQVAATSRKAADLSEAVGETGGDFLPLEMNLTDEASVKSAIDATIEKFGKVDVIVNNAGYGLGGALEELTDAEIRHNFDINVFGTVNVIRNVMPQLRAQGSGHIFNISSVGGFQGFGGFGSYCGTKYAIFGLTESLAMEVAPFGVKATNVAPGYFRTNFLSQGSIAFAENQNPAYPHLHALKDFFLNEKDGNQEGDPDKLAEVLIKVSEMSDPPVNLMLGKDAYQLAKDKFTSMIAEVEVNKELTTSTDFDDLEQTATV